MSENEFVNKKNADSNGSLDLKLNGDKIKLESRPMNKESTASSRSSLLGRAHQTRPLSAVPTLSLYSKNDYEELDVKTRRPYSADNYSSKNKHKHESFISNIEDSTSLESLEEEKHLPSSQIFRDLISEPIKSYRSNMNTKKIMADSLDQNIDQIGGDQKDYSLCLLTPGLATKPPLPKKSENKLPDTKGKSKVNAKENNMLSDDEIEMIRLKTLKFEEDFENKYEKNDLDDKVEFNMHEIMSEREFNNFLERTQSDIEKEVQDNYGEDLDEELQDQHREKQEYQRLQCGQSLSDRPFTFESESGEILTSKSDNDVNFRNWLSDEKKVNKSEERTDAFLKNLKSQHEQIDKCINKAQKVLDKTKKANNSKNVQELDEVDEKFNKFFEPPKKIPKNKSESKSKDPKNLPEKKKDKLNSLNETRKNKLKFIAKPINSFKDSVKESNGDAESWMSAQNHEKDNIGSPNFNSTTINSKIEENNTKVTEWLHDDRLTKTTSAKTSNFLDILENVEDLDVATRIENLENPEMFYQIPQHDNEVRTEVSESNTYDDIVQILEVLEAEDRKSQMNMESLKDIVHQELQYENRKNQPKIRPENIPIIKITETSSRSGSATSKSSDQGLGSTTSLNSCTSNYNQILSFLDEVDRNCTKSLTCAKERVQKVTKIVENIHLDTIPKREDLLSLTGQELCDQIIDLHLRLKEKSSSIKLLQQELSSLRDEVLKLTRQMEELVKQKLKSQKEEHEGVVKRHQKFIDQLISDKKSLNQQCESLISEIKMLEDRHNSNTRAQEQRHQIEMKKVKEMQIAGEKIRRDRWIDTKTQKIKELTVKSLEPELQSITVRHQQEISDLRSLHKKELEDLEVKAARRTQQQLENLRQQLADEREKALAHERDIMRQRYEKLVENEEKGYQEQRRRLQQEHANRLVECEEKEAAVLVEKDRAIKQAQEEFEDKIQTLIRRHKNEMKLLKETIDMETEAWKNNYRKQQTIQLIEKEAKIRNQFKKERDREIEEVIERLETEANESRIQIEQATENRVRRIKEKYESEIRDLEHSERDAKTKYSDTKSKFLECEDVIIGLRANTKQLEMQLKESREALDKLNKERNQLKDIVRREMKQDVESLEKEVCRLRDEKDKELQQVYSRVKIAVAKKDEVLSELTRDHNALQEKCVYLENMLAQQRKEYLIK